MKRQFVQVSDHVYVYPYDGYTDRPNIGLVVGDEYTMLFDAGNSTAHARAIQRSIREQGLPMPDIMCLSHWHWDHSFGCCAWDVPVIASKATNEQLRIMQKWKWDDQSMETRVASGQEIKFCHEMIKREYPDRGRIQIRKADIEFEGRMTINLGKIAVELIQCKGPHSSDSILLYIPDDQFLFLGDSNCKDLYGLPWEFDIAQEENFKRNTDALPYDEKKVKEYLELLETLYFTSCISGHSNFITRDQLLAKFI